MGHMFWVLCVNVAYAKRDQPTHAETDDVSIANMSLKIHCTENIHNLRPKCIATTKINVLPYSSSATMEPY